MPAKSQAQIVGANIRAELARRRKSQSDLGAHLGLSQSGVSTRLTGRVAMNVDELRSTADFLGLTLTELLQEPTADECVSAAS